MTVVPRRIRMLAGFGLLALGMISVGGVVWGALVYANLRTTPAVPWALPVLVILLWASWHYLDGHGWPASTAATRKALLRANRVRRGALGWSIVAGLLAIVALAGFWIVMFRIVPMRPNLMLPQRFTSSSLLIAAIIAGASLLAPIIEESAVRGYLQSVLEREFPPVHAVMLSSVVFAIAHVSQDVAWPKLLFYFLVGVTFGSLAYLNNSILPAIPVHIAGDVLFFVCIWPYDATRRPIANGGDFWLWAHVVQFVVFGALSIGAFCKLREIASTPPHAVRV